MTSYLLYRGCRLTPDSEHDTLGLAYRTALYLLAGSDSLYSCNIVKSDQPRFDVFLYVNRYDLEHPRKELV